MQDILIAIFGEYTPVMTDVYDSAGQLVGQAVVPGLAGVDWTYLSGVLLFAIVLYCALRLAGGLLKCK